MQDKLVYSVEEMGKALGIGRNKAYELCARADFPAVHVTEKRIVVPVEGLKRWLDNGGFAGGK